LDSNTRDPNVGPRPGILSDFFGHRNSNIDPIGFFDLGSFHIDSVYSRSYRCCFGSFKKINYRIPESFIISSCTEILKQSKFQSARHNYITIPANLYSFFLLIFFSLIKRNIFHCICMKKSQFTDIIWSSPFWPSYLMYSFDRRRLAHSLKPSYSVSFDSNEMGMKNHYSI
jgi:hypothetical protein